ncbi:alkaline phosphatase D family protein [Streptomyces sp. NPDC060194]|uniref:alkaline phosphatase D family protein n=1 Tax=Streptomyces sp. NPDC060194 TaxID=3347069 RepID=UPI0036554043
MARLRLGPLLRYVDWKSAGTATVWVESDRPATAEVRCEDGAGGEARTFHVAGHHYALVPVTGLTPGTTTPYEVLLDGERVWPLPDSAYPPSVIDTPEGGRPSARITFGSCRWAAPAADHGHDPVGPDALDTLATRIARDPAAERPDVLLLLGDQVYADEVSDATKQYLAERRDLDEPPGPQVANYEEYSHLYDESWLDPDVRWLLSTVPSCMIFDDHDVIDDWNTSESWVSDMRATDWWNERILSGLMSYWVYQHLGNLSPDELAADPLYAAVRNSDDATAELRSFAERADKDPVSVRWSYRRDFGRARLLMVDTRAARVLDEQNRQMVDAEEAAWLREQALEGGTDPDTGCDHVLVGTSLPWLLPHLIQDIEGWNAALSRGERGPRFARLGESIRRHGDLEHWAAFPASFDWMTDLVAEAGRGRSTVCVLSGDVHHAYVAEARWPDGEQPDAHIVQLTCSPVHNSVPSSIKFGFRFGWSRTGRVLGRVFARHGRLPKPRITWRRSGGPWFGNQLMTLTVDGRTARLSLDQAQPGEKADRSDARLETMYDERLTDGAARG